MNVSEIPELEGVPYGIKRFGLPELKEEAKEELENELTPTKGVDYTEAVKVSYVASFDVDFSVWKFKDTKETLDGKDVDIKAYEALTEGDPEKTVLHKEDEYDEKLVGMGGDEFNKKQWKLNRFKELLENYSTDELRNKFNFRPWHLIDEDQTKITRFTQGGE